MRGELESYVSASSGLPDPSYVRQQQTSIARLQAALDTLPKEAPGEEAFFNGLAQTIMGNYYDKTTPLGTVMQAAVSAIPHPVAEVLDLAADIRDVVYDFTNEDATKVGTFFDVLGFAPGAFDTLKYFKHAEAVGPLVKGLLALLPAAEVLKYVDELGLLGKGAKRADDMTDLADAAADTARTGQRLTETGEVVADTAKAAERAVDSADEVIDTSLSGVYNGQKGTNQEVREWYVHHALSISDSIDRSLSLEEQAKQACELRNILRTSARDLMSDSGMRAYLDQTHPSPTFEALLRRKMEDKGLSYEDALRDIIATATKTNESVNELFGIGRK